MTEEEKKEGKFKIIKDDGTVVECYPLITFENDGKHYILYTDNSLNENGETNVYAGTYDPDKGDQRFGEIVDQAEIDLVNKILATLNEKDNGEQA
jgi:uncharacterized protein YrzB (UPF0473 family)